MTSAIARKSVTDLTRRKARTFFTVLTLALAVASVGIFAVPSLLQHSMEREVARYTQEKIQKGTSWGELGHPNGPGINLDRISHLTKSLVREGDNWIGRAQIVDTAPGKTAIKLMEAGGTLGVSSRGLGSLKMDEKAGYQVVQDDFHLALLEGAQLRDVYEATAWRPQEIEYLLLEKLLGRLEQ